MRVVPLDAAHLAAWKALFEAASSPCFCRYWHFIGTKNEWLDRCAHTPETNAEEHAAAIARGDEAARGLIAVDPDGAVVGWMKLAPRASLPKLRALPVYRSLDLGDDEGVYSVGCFLVHPAHRHRGVAKALLAAADAYVLAWGGTLIEGYPRRTDAPIHPEEAWTGPESVFEQCGFVATHGEGPYPVFRKRLAGLV